MTKPDRDSWPLELVFSRNLEMGATETPKCCKQSLGAILVELRCPDANENVDSRGYSRGFRWKQGLHCGLDQKPFLLHSDKEFVYLLSMS